MAENTQVKVYKTEVAAERRQTQLMALGMWPGIVRCEGGWRLTSDPDTAGQRPHRATSAGD